MSRARIRVVFLLFYFEAWDSLAEVYNLMLADERFEPIIVTIPRKLTGYADFTDEDKVSAYLDARQIAHLRFDFADSMDGLSRLRELAPDYLFLNYPWQRNYQPGYQIENLIEFTKVCYVPYFSLPLVNEPGVEGVAPHLFTQPTHKLAHLVFLQDATVKAALAAGPFHRLAVAHGDAADVDAVLTKLEGVDTDTPILVGSIGPVVGTHAGPGIIGVCWITRA